MTTTGRGAPGIGPDYVRTEPGALYYDVAHELRRHGLQFYVNV